MTDEMNGTPIQFGRDGTVSGLLDVICQLRRTQLKREAGIPLRFSAKVRVAPLVDIGASPLRGRYSARRRHMAHRVDERRHNVLCDILVGFALECGRIDGELDADHR